VRNQLKATEIISSMRAHSVSVIDPVACFNFSPQIDVQLYSSFNDSMQTNKQKTKTKLQKQLYKVLEIFLFRRRNRRLSWPGKVAE